jgi:arylsulfatase A-like enzyme
MTALLLALVLQAAPAQAAPPPNIVVLDVCSARPDHMGAYGYSRPTSPRIDALAKQGAVFENAMAQSSWCLPNYASLFTGQTPEVHGLYLNKVRGIPEFEATLAEKLKDSGYATAAFSGGVYMLPEWGMSRGFDTYVTAFSTADPTRLPAPLEDNLKAVDQWLKGRSDTRPFMLYVAVDDLHAPYYSEDPDRFDPGYKGIAQDTDTASVPFARAYSGEPSGYDAATAKKAAEFKKDPRALAHLVARYDAALAKGDAEIGRFLDRLKQLGLDKNTIVVLTGDHGESLGEHGLLGHTQGLYEPTLRVPLIVRDPRRPALAGRRYKQLIERVDLMPTLLDFAGVDYSELQLAGRSFAPLLQDPTLPWRDLAFASSKRNLAEQKDLDIDERVARDARWKLHHYLYKDSYELYDLQADPGETKNVAAEHPEVVQRLSFELLKQVERSRPHAPGLPEEAAPRPASPGMTPAPTRN